MKMVSRSHAFGPTAGAADTKGIIGAAYKVPKGGTIKQIRVCFYQGTIDKSTTGILYLTTDVQKGPFEFAIGNSIGITTTSGATGPNCPTEVLDCNIPVGPQEEVTIEVKFSEAVEEVTASIHWE